MATYLFEIINGSMSKGVGVLTFKDVGITAVVATYNRSNILCECLISLINSHLIRQIIIVDDSGKEHITRNELFIKKLKEANRHVEIIHIETHKKNGSPKARNIGAQYAKYEIVIFVDDDMLIEGRKSLEAVLCDLSLYPDIGIVGGRLIEVVETIVDKPFYLNLNIADILSKVIGFIFLDILHGPRYSEFVPALMATRKVILKDIRFDPSYVGTAYREESDFQQSCKKLGWKLLFEPRFLAYHHGQERGGNRNENVDRQLYWRGRNHTYFILKHFHGFRKYWYLVMGTLLLIVNTPTRIRHVISGVRDSLKSAKTHA